MATPPEFLAAVAERFGPLTWGLAANASNAVAKKWLGPGSGWGEDALAADWATLQEAFAGRLWLNHPFGRSARFAAKCAEQAPAIAGSILMLAPAAVGSNWFAAHVYQKAMVLALRPRLKFVGHPHPYPKDLILAVYGRWVVPGFALWRWKEDESPF